MSVLLVDNTSFIRDRIRLRLNKSSHIGNIFEASEISSAIELFFIHHPDVVIIDAPHINDKENNIIEIIKHSAFRTILIVLTNFPSFTMIKRCKELGADYVFDKSSEFDKICDVLDKVSSIDSVLERP
ncbi:MAG: response regulator transcription factor [Ignavibacteriales bacterium]|nr:response regulator transcription factor [Ignavibacteriales bacterium]